MKGTFAYISADSWSIEELDDDHFEFRLGPLRHALAPLGTYLLVCTPGDKNAGERTADAAALAAATLGEAVVYRQLFTNVFSTHDSSVQVKGPTFGPPRNFPGPDLAGDTIRRFKDLYRALGSLSATDRARVQLSFRWFDEAVHAFNQDALLRYWFAIETLAMPSTTNIRPANQLLAKAYGRTEAEIRDWIELGRVQKLRSDITHNGLRAPLDPRLLNFVAAIYADLLDATLGLSCRERALFRKTVIGPSIAPLIPHS
jgi:hypothetical protein